MGVVIPMGERNPDGRRDPTRGDRGAEPAEGATGRHTEAVDLAAAIGGGKSLPEAGHEGFEEANLDPAVRRALYPMAARFADISSQLFATHDLRLAVQRVVYAAQRLVDGSDAVSLSIDTGGGYRTVAYTSTVTMSLDQAQYAASRGPCLDAARATGLGLVFCGRLTGGSPWPEFAATAADNDVHSVMAVGLFPTSEPPRIGALNFYSHTANALADTDHDLAVILAAFAGAALTAVTAVEAAEQRAEHLERALDHRDVIGQAKGILMARRGLTEQEALEVLTDASQRLHVKLHALAEQITADPGVPPEL